MVSIVLAIAGRHGGRDMHGALEQKLGRTTDLDSRDWLLGGLAATRVPELLDQNVTLATSGRLDPREISTLLTGSKYRELQPPLDSAIGRERVLAGVDQSWDRLVSLMPRGGLSRFFAVASQSCSTDERAEAERVFGPRVKSVLGGPRRFALSLERLDLCVAERTREVPELEKFFPAPRTARTPVGG
jgi:alanyl aminopeptidase